MIGEKPVVEVPLYHWALRTHWLLRIGEEEARGLIQVVDGIHVPDEPPSLTPKQQTRLLARELEGIHMDLEVLEHDPHSWIDDSLRCNDPVARLQVPFRLIQLRPKLEGMIHELVTVAGGPQLPAEGMDPFVAMLAACLPAEVVQGLRTTGAQVMTFCEEQGGGDSPPAVSGPAWALAARVVCDLGRCRLHAFALRGSPELETVAQWVAAQLAMELRDLKVLPLPAPQQREVA